MSLRGCTCLPACLWPVGSQFVRSLFRLALWQVLQEVVGRGLGVQAHAGDLPDGSGAEVNPCTNGDTNAMAAFLIGAGPFTPR